MPDRYDELRRLLRELRANGSDDYVLGWSVAAIMAVHEPEWWVAFAQRFRHAVEGSPTEAHLAQAARALAEEYPWQGVAS